MSLGCASEYQVVIHWRGGGQVYNVPELDTAVTAVSWQRVLNDTAEASVTIAKEAMTADCCTQLGLIEPWCHELSVYRDGDLVWQGPITEYEETRTQVVITAHDVTAWLAKLANYHNLRYEDRDATWIAWDIIRWNLEYAALSVPPDYPVMLDYIQREDCGSAPTVRRGVWIAYVLDIIEDLAQYGFQWTTIGRSLYLRDILNETADPQARLVGPDFVGELTVSKNGDGAATNGFATNQQQNTDTGVWSGQVYIASRVGTPYGRLDTIVNLSDTEASTTQLRTAARAAKGGRYPAPRTLDVPDGSQLSVNAPVTIEQLVCGERLDVQIADYCYSVSQGFRLTEVQGSWSGGEEKIQISLSPLTLSADEGS